jgi:hypothetical protein
VPTQQFLKLLDLSAGPATTKPSPETPSAAPAPVDLSFESVTAFRTKVQPILMNTCGSCHCGSYTGSFRLSRVTDGSNGLATQRNLAAVVAQLQADKPAASPLLVMAVSAHGNAKSPAIGSRQAAPFLSLAAWVDQTIAHNPHLRDRSAAALKSPTSLPASVGKAPPLAAGERNDSSSVSDVPPGVVVSHGLGQSQTTPGADKTAPEARGPVGEYDPEEFNRWAHPQHK